ncbi:MAG: SCO family protein [Gammaproteobacteria bacterium]|nr:SCO family protein [Gammaproteobacteria bacterium]
MKLLLIVFSCLLLAGCPAPKPTFQGTDMSFVDFGSSPELTGHDGNRHSVSEYGGKIVAVFFGYATCPHICAPVLYKLAKVRAALGEKASSFQILFVTVDPEADTPEVLKKFVDGFDADIMGLTGTVAEIEAAKQHYKVGAIERIDENKKRVIDHSGAIFIYDTKGKLRLLFQQDAAVDAIAADITALLNIS